MRIPLYLAVAQWALLLSLGLLVIVMYRQLGRVFTRTRPDAALGPPIGSAAAGFGYARIGSDAMRQLTPGGGQPMLLAFADPTCPSCEQLVTTLGEADAAGELDGVRALLITADPPAYLQISPAFQATRLEIGRAVPPSGLAPYNAHATPLLVAIDAAGIVRAAGSAARRTEVQAYLRACALPAADKMLTVVPVPAVAERQAR